MEAFEPIQPTVLVSGYDYPHPSDPTRIVHVPAYKRHHKLTNLVRIAKYGKRADGGIVSPLYRKCARDTLRKQRMTVKN